MQAKWKYNVAIAAAVGCMVSTHSSRRMQAT